MPKTIKELEEELIFEDDYDEVPPPDIIAYNELRSCADLFRMYTQKILEIQPEFQRDFVWQAPQQTRFIDSLIKSLPIPSMCFALDNKQQKWMVIDGLQRISTIIRFLEGGDWKLSKLDDIDKNIAGQSVAEMKINRSDLHQYYTRVENLSIPVTVLRCDFNNDTHLDYLFTIFHRLNTGAVKLNNQEIRNCIYGGELNNLLKKLDQFPAWRKINKMKVGGLHRFTKQEIILRFFAFHDRHKKYTGHLAKFLNDYMYDFRNPGESYLQNKKELFQKTVNCLYEKVFDEKSPKKTPITVLEGLLVGIGKNIDILSSQSTSHIKNKAQKVTSHNVFSEKSLTEGLSKKPRVIERLDTAIQIFSGS